MPELSYSIDDFQARFPDLQRRGRGLAGPCPLCGGEDRFHVNQDGVFGCRGCIDDDAPQAAENVKAIFRLLEGEDTSPRQGTTYSRHVCGRFCVDYERVDGRGQIRQHRDDGLPKKDRHWTTPSLGKRPATHVRLYGPTSGPVVLCEGEKAARAVEDAGYRAASWLGGTSGVGQASFSPAAGPGCDSVARRRQARAAGDGQGRREAPGRSLPSANRGHVHDARSCWRRPSRPERDRCRRHGR